MSKFNLLPVDRSPDRYFKEKIYNLVQSDRKINRELFSRIAYLIAGPVFAFQALSYHTFSTAVKIPISGIRGVTHIFNFHVDLPAKYFPQSSDLQTLLQHIIKVIESVGSLIAYPTLGTAYPKLFHLAQLKYDLRAFQQNNETYRLEITGRQDYVTTPDENTDHDRQTSSSLAPSQAIPPPPPLPFISTQATAAPRRTIRQIRREDSSTEFRASVSLVTEHLPNFLANVRDDYYSVVAAENYEELPALEELLDQLSGQSSSAVKQTLGYIFCHDFMQLNTEQAVEYFRQFGNGIFTNHENRLPEIAEEALNTIFEEPLPSGEDDVVLMSRPAESESRTQLINTINRGNFSLRHVLPPAEQRRSVSAGRELNDQSARMIALVQQQSETDNDCGDESEWED